MFDSLKKKLKEFTGRAAEEAELKEASPAPPRPAPAPTPAPKAPAPLEVVRKPSAAPKKSDDDLEDELDEELAAELAEIEAEIAKEDAKTAPPARREAPPPPPPPAPPTRDIPELAPPKQEPPSQPAAKSAPAPAPAPAAKPTPTSAPKAPAEGSKSINVDKIDDLLFDLEVSLLESDVALPVVEEIKAHLTEKLAKVRVKSNEDIPAAVEHALRESIRAALSQERIDFDEWLLDRMAERKPVVIMFVGVNGTGKTTAIGRVAHRLKENAITCVMAAGDTFRAGAIQQLEKHGEKLGITVIKTQAGGDPAAVAYDAIEHAKGRHKDVVLLDTAGRMQTNTNLMDEMKKIKRVAQPDMIVFVGDSLAGNDAVEQAQKFNAAVGIHAVILTKVDTDAKGGAALSIAHAVGKPVLFLGVGQEYQDLVAYDPDWMVNRIFEESPSA